MDRALIQDDVAGQAWLPAWVGSTENGYYVEWCHAGQYRLREPFFQDSLNRLMREPVNHFLRHRTPIEALERFLARSPGLRPSGFVFHTSRCGSTLVSQMLASLQENVVLSEPPPLDAVLGAVDPRTGQLHEERAKWLLWMIGALGQRRASDDRYLFVKFDAWHASQLALIRRQFSDVPWIFVYREPREVLASHLRQPGAFLLRMPDGGPISPLAAVDGSTLVERVVNSLSSAYAAVLAALPSGRGMLVNYRDLPRVMFDRVVRHFGLELSTSDRAAMCAVTGNDAKSPWLPFERTAASGDTLPAGYEELLERRVSTAYRELERLRGVD